MLSEQELEILKSSAKNVRRNILKMIHSAKSGHPGGSLSGVDILTVLYKKSLTIPKNWKKSLQRFRHLPLTEMLRFRL